MLGPRAKAEADRSTLDVELKGVDIVKTGQKMLASDPNTFETAISSLVYLDRGIGASMRRAVGACASEDSLIDHYLSWSWTHFRMVIDADRYERDLFGVDHY